MDRSSKELIEQWLAKLERESWQLELLVSGFTIFLLLGAHVEYKAFLIDLQYSIAISNNVLGLILIFLNLLRYVILSLIFFLIVHLILRGFWIGTIGLRSVQDNIDFSALGYAPFFKNKLQKRVEGLDHLVVILDEICSVIFSVAFLIISMIVAFGLWLIFFGFFGYILSSLFGLLPDSTSAVSTFISAVIMLLFLATGIIYLVDYFTLGIIKKNRFIAKLYYPFYKLYGIITLSAISRSIYYYLISKYPKRRIRQIGLALIGLTLLYYSFGYDQFRYFPSNGGNTTIYNHYYDDARPVQKHVIQASIQSKIIDGPFLELFLRYDPRDNTLIKSNCPDFEPLKPEGINTRLKLITDKGNFLISAENYEEEDKEKLKSCLASLYSICINDSTYQNLNFYFYIHPQKKQKGLMTIIPTNNFKSGENKLIIKKTHHSTADSTSKTEDFVDIPFWYVKK